MKFAMQFERVYPHPQEKVWRALIEPAALGEWLMKTDFVPEIGSEFKMWCENEEGSTDTYHCKLLAYEPPTRMLWSWVLDGRRDQSPMQIEFHVEAVARGTKVTITHTGDRDADTIAKFKGGWPGKLDLLDSELS